jgi:hypothetical protein
MHHIYVVDRNGKTLFDFNSISVPRDGALFHLVGPPDKHFRVLSQEWLIVPKDKNQPNGPCTDLSVELMVTELP